MSIGSLGIIGSVVGAPSAGKAADVAKSQEAVADRIRHAHSETAADDAAGVGRTDGENHEATDRDADGRLGYAFFHEPAPNGEESSVGDSPAVDAPQAIDPTGTSGSHLDLTG